MELNNQYYGQPSLVFPLEAVWMHLETCRMAWINSGSITQWLKKNYGLTGLLLNYQYAELIEAAWVNKVWMMAGQITDNYFVTSLSGC